VDVVSKPANIDSETSSNTSLGVKKTLVDDNPDSSLNEDTREAIKFFGRLDEIDSSCCRFFC
jgi:hypothetical protein